MNAQRITSHKFDDTFIVRNHGKNFILDELNQINDKIIFKAEEEIKYAIPFIGCLINRRNENKLKNILQNKTHTGKYFDFHSNQPVPVKLLTIKYMTKRTKIICYIKLERKKEVCYINKIMQLNKF